jgi:hypothetical protein
VIIFVALKIFFIDELYSIEKPQSNFPLQNSNANIPTKQVSSAFIENKGQWSDEIRYMVKLQGLNIWLTNDGIVYDYYKKDEKNLHNELGKTSLQKNPFPNGNIKGHIINTTYLTDKSLNQSFTKGENGNKHIPSFITSNAHKEYFNYFKGKESSKWTTNVSLYDEVIEKNVFPGIDARYYFESNNNFSQNKNDTQRLFFRYDFIVHPGANVSDIKIKADLGRDTGYKIYINNSNELIFKTNLGDMIHQKPFSYQSSSDEQLQQISNLSKFEDYKKDVLIKAENTKEITSSFIINEDGTLGFNISDYDNTKPLVIDPLVYSTFLGGNYYDLPSAISLDSNGNVYICGSTYSTDFPKTAGAYDTTQKGYYDCFVSKLNSTGTSLIYSTFIGGSDYDYATALSLDVMNDVYLTGYTFSNDFPTTDGAFQNKNWGNSNCYVLKLSSDGTSLSYSTYFGGGNYDYATGIAIDGTGSSFITGYTNSSAFPTSANAYKKNFSGNYDCFFAKFDNFGKYMLYSTYIGGSNDDYSNSIALDGIGNSYITGYTNSSDFPTTNGAYSTSLKGNYDCFVVKLNETGQTLSYSTLIGGTNDEYANAIALDADRNAYITGYTYSYDFPTSKVAVSNTTGGNYDCFATKLNATGSALVYSTYIGGSNHDYGTSIVVNANGSAFIAGNTYSTDFPTTTNAFDVYHNGAIDGFLLKLNTSGATLAYSTFFGGTNDDYISGIAVGDNKNLFLTGNTYSIDFPITDGVNQTSNAGYSDGFVANISDLSFPIITGRPYYYEYCAGNPMWVYFSTDDFVLGTGTTFYAQLSDSSGQFNNPVILGTFTSASSGYIQGQIPNDTPQSLKYRVRVVSTNPDTTGNDNGYDIAIYAMPPKPTISKPGTELVSSSPSGNQWYLNNSKIEGATAQKYTAKISGIYSVQVTNLYSCISEMSEPFLYGINSIEWSENSNSLITTNNIFYIELTDYKTLPQLIKVFNLLGQEVYSASIDEPQNSNELKIDLSMLSEGVYSLILINGNNYNKKNIIIQH